MEDIWNITALVVSVLSVLLSLYALRQATTKNTSDMYLFFYLAICEGGHEIGFT